jgi:hypothetical protein
MKTLIYILTVLSLFSCSVNNNSIKSKHYQYVKHQKNNKVGQLPIQNVNVLNEDVVKKDFEEGLYQMLLKMTVEERRAFSRDFIYTEKDISCVDSLLKK